MKRSAECAKIFASILCREPLLGKGETAETWLTNSTLCFQRRKKRGVRDVVNKAGGKLLSSGAIGSARLAGRSSVLAKSMRVEMKLVGDLVKTDTTNVIHGWQHVFVATPKMVFG